MDREEKMEEGKGKGRALYLIVPLASTTSWPKPRRVDKKVMMKGRTHKSLHRADVIRCKDGMEREKEKAGSGSEDRIICVFREALNHSINLAWLCDC